MSHWASLSCPFRSMSRGSRNETTILRRRRQKPNSLAGSSASPAIPKPTNCGGARIMTTPWISRPMKPCSAISTMRNLRTAASPRGSPARTTVSSCLRKAPTAKWPSSRSNTRSASSHCSSTWCRSPAAGCRRCRSHGIPKGIGGSRSIPARRSRPMTGCTGRVTARTGTACAPNATRPTCRRTSMQRPTPSIPPGPKSM